ncbi:hypothetical protein CDAR_426461 [Caerostris darwini]|uniref:Uncharacterized protein n=1 Tax=Caerostris darwini TaxID=1538125 RepID=A0AAV4S1D8_9ARAC|nr:hypothetical protein CDAR_426461 [Caerostris darwini]
MNGHVLNIGPYIVCVLTIRSQIRTYITLDPKLGTHLPSDESGTYLKHESYTRIWYSLTIRPRIGTHIGPRILNITIYRVALTIRPSDLTLDYESGTYLTLDHISCAYLPLDHKSGRT